jgi:hypothetical protein
MGICAANVKIKIWVLDFRERRLHVMAVKRLFVQFYVMDSITLLKVQNEYAKYEIECKLRFLFFVILQNIIRRVMSAGSSPSSISANGTVAALLPHRANATLTKMFLPRAVIIQREKVYFCAARTFPNEASVLHAIEGDPKKQFLFIPNARSLFVAKFQQKITQSNQTRKIFEKLIVDHAQYDCKGITDTTLTRNATLIFHQVRQVAKAAADKLPDYIEAYTKACLKRGYCFTRFDLPLIADVFERRLCVYSRLGNYEADFGEEHHQQIILVESQHNLGDAGSHPVYTRFAQQADLKMLSEMRYDRLTAPEIDKPLRLYRDLTLNFNRVQVPIDIFQSIFDYADIPFETYVNEGMQAVLRKEEWNILLQSFQNWNFVQALHRRVSHLCCPSENAEMVQRIKHIACSSLFPRLSSIQFSALSLDDYLIILTQNPQCRSLMFEAISLEDLNTIFIRLPMLAKQLTTLTVRLEPRAKQWWGGKGSSTTVVTVPQVLKPLESLKGLSIMIQGDGELDESIQKAILEIPHLNYLDLNNRQVSLAFVKAFVDKTRPEMIVSAIDVSWRPLSESYEVKPVRYSPECLTVKNCIKRSDGTLLTALCKGRLLTRLNVSRVSFSFRELCTITELAPNLRYLDLGFSYEAPTRRIGPTPRLLISKLFKLPHLEYLDIVKCGVLANDLENLDFPKSLQTLKYGTLFIHTWKRPLRSVLEKIQSKS